MGQLATTSYVENYPGFPQGNMSGYLRSALAEERVYAIPEEALKDEETRGVSGPALMELMRQQAENFGTRVVSDDVVKVDFTKRPFTL